MIKLIFGILKVLIFIGFMLLLGTAGSADLGRIGFGAILAQCAAGLFLILFGFIGSRLIGSVE